MKFYSDALSLNEIIDELAEEATEAMEASESVALGDVIERFEERGFGPLIFIPALIAVIPTGAIPGVPSICGVLIVLISIQIIIGKHSPWLPNAISDRSIGADKLLFAIQKIRPFSEKVSRFFYPRWESLTEDTAEMVIAVCCVIAGFCMIPLELVPFAVAIPGIAIMLAAIGLATKDGLVVAVAGLIFALTIMLIWKFLL